MISRHTRHEAACRVATLGAELRLYFFLCSPEARRDDHRAALSGLSFGAGAHAGGDAGFDSAAELESARITLDGAHHLLRCRPPMPEECLLKMPAAAAFTPLPRLSRPEAAAISR